MQFYDFEYDGLVLSDLGYIVCSFGDNGLETFSSGSQIVFNTVPTHNGEKYEKTSIKYDDCIEMNFQISKHPCKNYNDWEITEDEYHNLRNWLNRKNFYKFRFKKDEYSDVYLEASFNISRIIMNGKLYGLELNMKTNRPYALRDTYTKTFDVTASDNKFVIYNESNNDSSIYPMVKITVNQSGNLDIYNSFEDRHTYIANCTQGEVITMDYPIIQSSLDSHKIQNDFNWNFFRLVNTFRNKENNIVVSLPCSIELSYNPIVNIVL